MAQTEAEVARKTDTIMAQADKDGDGVVTFDGEIKKGDNDCHFRQRVQRYNDQPKLVFVKALFLTSQQYQVYLDSIICSHWEYSILYTLCLHPLCPASMSTLLKPIAVQPIAPIEH